MNPTPLKFKINRVQHNSGRHEYEVIFTVAYSMIFPEEIDMASRPDGTPLDIVAIVAAAIAKITAPPPVTPPTPPTPTDPALIITAAERDAIVQLQSALATSGNTGVAGSLTPAPGQAPQSPNPAGSAGPATPTMPPVPVASPVSGVPSPSAASQAANPTLAAPGAAAPQMAPSGPANAAPSAPAATPPGTVAGPDGTLKTTDGRAVYTFDPAVTPGTQPNTGAWPPVIDPTTGTQATLNGNPLYTFVNDAPSDPTAHGDGMENGAWKVARLS